MHFDELDQMVVVDVACKQWRRIINYDDVVMLCVHEESQES